MRKIYEYVDKEIKKSSLNLIANINKTLRDNLEDLVFEDTRAKTKKKVTNTISNFLRLEFEKLFMLGQVHGIKSVDDLSKNSNKVKEFSSYLEDLASFENVNGVTYPEKRETTITKLKKINQKEKRPRLANRLDINYELNSPKEFITDKGDKGVYPTPMMKLNNFKEYLRERKGKEALKITDGYLELFPSYPKEIRNKYVQDKNKFVKSEIEEATKEYMSYEINPNLKGYRADKERGLNEVKYIDTIKRKLNFNKVINKQEIEIEKLELKIDKSKEEVADLEKVLGERSAYTQRFNKKLQRSLDKTKVNLNIDEKKLYKISRELAKDNNQLNNKITEIVVTELRAGYGIGRILSYAKMGITEVVWSAEPEHLFGRRQISKNRSRKIICAKCESMNGEIVPLQAILSSSYILNPKTKEKIQPFLPSHPFCACVYLPVKEDLKKNKQTVKGLKEVKTSEDIIKQNQNLLSKALGAIGLVSSVGILMYALRKDLKNFIINGTFNPEIEKLIDTPSFEEEDTKEIDKDYKSNVVKALEELKQKEEDKDRDIVLNIIEQVSPENYQDLQRALQIIEQEKESIIEAIKESESLLDDYNALVKSLVSKIKKGEDIDNNNLLLVNIRSKLEKEIDILQELRLQFSNSSAYLNNKEVIIQKEIDKFLKKSNYNLDTQKYYLNLFGKVANTEKSNIIINSRIDSEIKRLNNLRKYIYDTLLEINSNQSLSNVSQKIEEDFLKTTGKLSKNKKTLALVGDSLIDSQRALNLLKRTFTNTEVNNLKATINNLINTGELSLTQYNKLKLKVEELKKNLKNIETFLIKYKDLDLEFLEENTVNTGLKNFYRDLRIVKDSYLENKKLVYDLDYTLELTKKNSVKVGKLEHLDTLAKKEALINNLKNKGEEIKYLVNGIVDTKTSSVISGKINTLLTNIKNLDKETKTSSKLSKIELNKSKDRRIKLVLKDLEKIKELVVKELDNPNAVIIIEDKFEEYKKEYLKLKLGYENLEYKRSSKSLAEFNRSNIIEKEQLSKLLNYVSKLPTKYKRLDRLF